MRKEKQIHECERKQLLDELSKMPDMVIATAYLEAINYALYGVDVTKAWNTAIQQNEALEKAYVNGYTHGIENTAKEFKTELDQQNSVLNKIKSEIEELQLIGYATVNGKREIASRAVLQILDKHRTESEVNNG